VRLYSSGAAYRTEPAMLEVMYELPNTSLMILDKPKSHRRA
jgi:hypothetical protein